MTIYVCHASSFDYQRELYEPLKDSVLAKIYSFIFPHDSESQVQDSAAWIEEADLILAEVSYPSTGLGIEMGVAYMKSVPILAIHKDGIMPSSSIQFVTKNTLVYEDTNAMIKKIAAFLDSMKH